MLMVGLLAIPAFQIRSNLHAVTLNFPRLISPI